MKKVKRAILALVLTAACAASLAACGQTATTSTAAPAAAETTAAPAPTQAPATQAPATTAAAPAAQTTAAPAPTEAAPAGPDGLPAYTGGPVELRFGWWGDDNRAALTNQVIDEFMKAYPSITVKGEPNGGTADHFQIIDTQLQGNNAPDLIQFGGNYGDYMQYLEPLDGYLGKQILINDPAVFDQTALIPATRNGNLWVASLGTNTLVLIYNKSLVESVGGTIPTNDMTWEDLEAWGEDLKAKLPAGVYPFADNCTNQANYLSYYYQQLGTPLWTAEEVSYATVESAQKWLGLWASWRDKGLIPDADTTAAYAELGADTSAVIAGKAAVTMVWSNQIAGYAAATTDTLAAFTLPEMTGGEKAYIIQMSQYIGINKASANKEAAALFVNFITTSPAAGNILRTNRGVPSSPIVREAISGSSTELDAAVYAIYDAVADRTIPQGPNLPNDQEFVNELALIGQNVAYGESVDDGAQELQSLIERLIIK
ncbi:MAG: extracellular solute-binding protein [Lachnospiraceae bacterium]|jgi:multiple sugar transport system substrate-binding protein|nr:extracellular solute-binding protein [Lachnospiraceae bacterium]